MEECDECGEECEECEGREASGALRRSWTESAERREVCGGGEVRESILFVAGRKKEREWSREKSARVLRSGLNMDSSR